MPSYAIAHLQDVTLGPDIVAYLKAIDATLAPYGGTFLIHGDGTEVLEGPWAGDIIVIAFLDGAQARAWYASPAYQAILPLRTRNARGWVVLAEGVSPGHRATDLLERLPA